MRSHKDALLSSLLGFALTSAIMLPPILTERAEKAARIAAHDAALAQDGVAFGRERQARLAHLLRGYDEAREETAASLHKHP